MDAGRAGAPGVRPKRLSLPAFPELVTDLFSPGLADIGFMRGGRHGQHPSLQSITGSPSRWCARTAARGAYRRPGGTRHGAPAPSPLRHRLGP
ncbi:hypothetical protein EXM25_10570 [Mycobacteroides abscessus subsp. massiliense]|nr:hypothetical protein EXM25_10570 [Mycobacteroides abscessus subsp. massiliense]QBE82588.1 hypothetical protein EXM27_10570 [Mycobacteroides abscessus subsp. massiliense]